MNKIIQPHRFNQGDEPLIDFLPAGLALDLDFNYPLPIMTVNTMDVYTVSKTSMRIIFAFVEVTVLGFFSIFLIIGYSQYLSLKEFFHTKIKTKMEEVFFNLKLLIEGKFQFNLVPYSVKRRFIELLPEAELENFRKASKEISRLATSLRGPVIEEISLEFGEIWESCKLQKNKSNPQLGALIIPSNLVSKSSYFQVSKKVKRLGIMGTATPRDYLIDKAVLTLPEGIDVDWFFIDLDVGDIQKLKKLIRKLSPKKLSMSLGFEDSDSSLDQVLDMVDEKVEEIE